jgi:lipopolysaccharide heptosyltransferase I
MAVVPRPVAQRAQERLALRFLIVRLSALGDVVCTLPAAVALKRTFPECETVWCVDKRFAGITELCPSIDRVAILPEKDQTKFVKDLGQFDFAFDMQGLLKSGYLVGAARATKKLGYHWQREGSFLFSQKVKPDKSSLHVTDQYVDVVRAVGAEMDRAEFDLKPDPKDVERLAKELPQGFIACNAGAGWATKRWPAGHFAELADELSRRDLPVVFIGGPGDREVFQEVRVSGAQRAVDMVGKTSVRELVALLSLARAHVGGDTGSTHISAALGIPAVGLYALTRPERSCPYGQRQNTLYEPTGLGNIPPEGALATLSAAIGLNC